MPHYEDPILDMVAPDTVVEAPGDCHYEFFDPGGCGAVPYLYQRDIPPLPGAAPAAPPPSYGYARFGGAGAPYSSTLYTVPKLGGAPAPAPLPAPPARAALPVAAPAPPAAPGIVWQSQFWPDPRTVPLKGLADPSHANEDLHGVKYIRDLHRRRSRYEVTLGARMTRRMEIFDTAKIKAVYRHKLGANVGDRLTPEEKAKPITPKVRARIGAAFLGKDAADQRRWTGLAREWGLESLIWVCALEDHQERPSFYSHIGKIQKFHHSSFKAGRDVIGAGEWIVTGGKLLKISANSGHYRPTIDHLHRCVLYMAEAWSPETVVLLWNIRTDAWEEVPVLTFRNSPSQNGTYKAHPSG